MSTTKDTGCSFSSLLKVDKLFYLAFPLHRILISTVQALLVIVFHNLNPRVKTSPNAVMGHSNTIRTWRQTHMILSAVNKIKFSNLSLVVFLGA